MYLRFIAVFFAAIAVFSQPALAFDTIAKSALVVDYETGTILLSKNSDTPMPPASMSKLMTLNMLFEALAVGRLTLDDTFPVSENASQKGGSKMFVRQGARIKIKDLIMGIIVQSGNDACIVVAEGMAGSEKAFADLMTIRARELGMNNSNFVNATGWPDPGQEMSARDLVFLAQRLIHKFPQYYGFFSEKSFTWEGIAQNNRNPLLSLNIGADGLKTGHTEEAGYGLVGSAVRDGRRIIFMIGGLDSSAARSSEADRISSWAFREFAMKTLFEANEPIEYANVWLGAEASVPMQLSEDIELLLPLSSLSEISAVVSFVDPVEAPVQEGQQLGELLISIPEQEVLSYPLLATKSVETGGFRERLNAAANILLTRIRAKTSGN